MNQKGFATIFGLCLMLIITLIVKGIQEAEMNHAREVMNFEMEQALHNAAESGLIKAAESVRAMPSLLPYSDARYSDKKKILNVTENLKCGRKTIKVKIEVWGERGKIYFYKKNNEGTFIQVKEPHDGVYFMSRATTDDSIWSEKIYRRAYGYVTSEANGDTFIDDTKIHFMELPTQDGNEIRKKK